VSGFSRTGKVRLKADATYGLFTGLKPRATYFQARRWAYNPPDLTFTVVLDFVSSESGEIV
jgi:hypothetical protein